MIVPTTAINIVNTVIFIAFAQIGAQAGINYKLNFELKKLY